MRTKSHNLICSTAPQQSTRFASGPYRLDEGKPAFAFTQQLGGCAALRTTYGIVFLAVMMFCASDLPTRAQEASPLTETVQPSSTTAKTGQESSDIAKAAQNPIAHMISVPFENDFYPQTGINKENEYVLEIKPVVPIPLSKDWILVTRTIIPVIQTPDLAPGITGTSGLGDIQESLFFSPTKAGLGGIIWGAGPAIVAPTATQEIYGTGKTCLGPNLVVLKSQGHWLYGSLAQNVWSVEAGPRDRPAVNQMLVQPFVNYNLPHRWYLVSSPIITANWKVDNGRWFVPVGGGVGKIVRFGKVPVNIYGQFFGNAEHPNGTSKLSARFQMQFLFPRKG
jgi:hypothetical protein